LRIVGRHRVVVERGAAHWLFRKTGIDSANASAYLAAMSTEQTSAAARRAAMIAEIQARTGIDEAMIERVIRGFYRRVQSDPVIGPVFAARIVDWEPHLQQMFAFWSSVTLMSGRYHGQPMQKHLPLPVDGRHFDRWLELFEQTARELCAPAAADHFVTSARRIGESLELGIATASGKMLHPGERLRRPELDVA
jgi:hemoglobin